MLIKFSHLSPVIEFAIATSTLKYGSIKRIKRKVRMRRLVSTCDMSSVGSSVASSWRIDLLLMAGIAGIARIAGIAGITVIKGITVKEKKTSQSA